MRFIESICYQDGEYQNLDLHQERLNNTCFNFFGEVLHHLSDLLPRIDDERKHKVRFTYDNSTHTCEALPYVKLPIQSLQVVNTTWFDYSFKYEDRSTLQELLSSASADEIIICIDGLVRDCSYANLVFWDGKEWLTPEAPLLEGVKRSRLLNEGQIKKAAILCEDLAAFQKVSLINAMLDLGELEVPISKVLKTQSKS